MKRLAIAITATLIATLHSAESFAAPSYFIELGSYPSLPAAEGRWQALVNDYPSMLGHLRLYPKTEVQDGIEVETRIQAGPISNKTTARRVCQELFSGNIPCFVIEGVNNTPPSVLAHLAEGTENREYPDQAGVRREAADYVPLPWLSGDAASQDQGVVQPQAQAEEREGGFFPWLFGGSKKESERGEQEAQPSAPMTPQVDVSEAIRVPLTESVTVSPLMPIAASAVTPVQAEADDDASAQDTASGWLLVSAFHNEETAASFWREVRQNVPDQTRGLRVRIRKPLLASNRPATSLKIGPFASRVEANAFCLNGLNAPEIGLNCSFEATAPESDIAMPPRYSHGDAYASRRERLMKRRQSASSSVMAAPARTARLYWIQVVSAASEIEALRKWERIRGSNSDVLSGLRSSVSATLSNRNHYVVRVGPLSGSEDATQLCDTLQQRGVNCKVMLYSNR